MKIETEFLLAAGIFLASYGLIISERIHRTVVALAGAVLMIMLGILNQEQAIEGVDFNTLGLLIGMMMIVSIAKDSGMFQFLAIWIAKLGRGRVKPIFFSLLATVAILSGLLDNVTTALLMVPVMFVIASNLKVDPKPFLIGTILFANFGGVMTLIGDPTNILIGSAAGLSFNDFILNTAPAAVIAMTCAAIVLWLLFRKRMIAAPGSDAAIMAFNPKDAITDWPLLRKSLTVLALVLIGFITHNVTHLEGATIALAGAALLLLATLNDPEPHLRQIEWTSIFFFVGLFILVTGLEHVGAIRMLAEQLLMLTGGDPIATTLVILWGSAVLSALIDNIPLVATMIPLITEIGVLTGLPLAPLWWALSLGGNVGGNATLIGASTNVVVSGIAKREGHGISFIEYLKIATPITGIAIIIFSAYIYLRYLS